jgi:hypothetical protein
MCHFYSLHCGFWLRSLSNRLSTVASCLNQVLRFLIGSLI